MTLTLIELLVVLVPFSLAFTGGFLLTGGQPLLLRISTGLFAGILAIALLIRAQRWAFRDDEPA